MRIRGRTVCYWSNSVSDPDFLAHLRERKFPEPNDIIVDTDEYFQEVAQNKDILDETRVSAATLAGFMQYPYWTRQVQNAFRMHMALEDAIHAYNADFKVLS